VIKVAKRKARQRPRLQEAIEREELRRVTWKLFEIYWAIKGKSLEELRSCGDQGRTSS
jgi:hypothetical protein